jgi:hypothetical protein
MRTAKKNIVDRVVHLEKGVLGCLWEFCLRGSAKQVDGVIAAGLSADQFTTNDHRAIFGALKDLRNEGMIPDQLSLVGKLDGRAQAQICDFTMGVVSTLSSREAVSLSDPRMLRAAEGADVFLDTAVRFMEGSENDAQDTRPFVRMLFSLLHTGVRSITGAHHAPKGFERENFMTLENILRGSGDIGAMLSTAWGVRQVDGARTALYVQNLKPRDFQPCQPFLLEGRPHLGQVGAVLYDPQAG